eukprot:5161973-Pleurochrysis_carterae.AAC.2
MARSRARLLRESRVEEPEEQLEAVRRVHEDERLELVLRNVVTHSRQLGAVPQQPIGYVPSLPRVLRSKLCAAEFALLSAEHVEDVLPPRVGVGLRNGAPLLPGGLNRALLQVLRQMALPVVLASKVLQRHFAHELGGDTIRRRRDEREGRSRRAHEVGDEAFVGKVRVVMSLDHREKLRSATAASTSTGTGTGTGTGTTSTSSTIVTIAVSIFAKRRGCEADKHRVFRRAQHLLEPVEHQQPRPVALDLQARADQVVHLVHQDDLVREGVAVALKILVAVLAAVVVARAPRRVRPATRVPARHGARA